MQDKGLCHSFSKQAELGDNVLDLRDVVVDVVIALAAELTRAEHPVVYLFQGIGPIGHSIEAEIHRHSYLVIIIVAVVHVHLTLQAHEPVGHKQYIPSLCFFACTERCNAPHESLCIP